MKYFLPFIFSLSAIFAQSQEIPKGANSIKITGVGFREIAMKLLDDGFSFAKIDSNFQTLRTEYNSVKGYSIKYDVRVKDSVAFIKGTWTSSNYVFDIEYQKWKPDRNIFEIEKNFALSFNKPIEYLIMK